MKKTGFIIMATFAIVLGLLIGTLNSGQVSLDLLWVQVDLPLGLVILLGFSAGILTGLGFTYLFRVIPLRIKLHKANTRLPAQDTPGLSAPDD